MCCHSCMPHWCCLPTFLDRPLALAPALWVPLASSDSPAEQKLCLDSAFCGRCFNSVKSVVSVCLLHLHLLPCIGACQAKGTIYAQPAKKSASAHWQAAVANAVRTFREVVLSAGRTTGTPNSSISRPSASSRSGAARNGFAEGGGIAAASVCLASAAPAAAEGAAADVAAGTAAAGLAALAAAFAA